MATGSRGGSVSKYARPRAATPPGNALLATEVAAQKRQDAGLNPSTTPMQAVHKIVHGLTDTGPQTRVIDGKTVRVNAPSVLTPLTLGISTIAHLGSIIGGAHHQAVALAHPSAANPPGLGREVHAVLSGALGFPRMGVDEPKPHPLISAKPTIQKGPAPTVNTLGQAVTGGLKGARGARGEQEIARSAERGARADAFGKALQANPTVEGAKQASKLLAGEYPKVRFSGFENLNPDAQSAMVKAISAHPELQEFQQKRAIDAVGQIIDGKVPTRGDEKLLRTVFGPDTTKDMMMSVSHFHQLRALGYDVANIPRSVMASFDVSGIMRQALMVGTGHPLIWAKNVPDYLKAMKSEDVYNAGMAALHQRPNALNGVWEKMGVEMTELTPKGSSAAAREEAFRSPLAEKIPGVRMSGRGYTLFLDKVRADLADHMHAIAVKNEGKMIRRVEFNNGKPQIVKRAIDPNDPKLLESIGDVVNSSAGRGDLGNGVIGRSAEGLNLLLFSPKLAKSRIDFLNPYWYAKLDPLARHQAYRAMGGLVVLTATALEIAHTAGASVNLDPRSSDFAKIKIGKTRIDLAGGFQQYTRLLAEIVTQQRVDAAGKVSHLGGGPGQMSDLALVMRFLRSKLAPVASAITDVAAQRTAVGQPLSIKNSVVSRVTPLTGQDAVSVGQDVGGAHGIPAGVLAGLGAFGLGATGVGIQNYTPKAPKAPSRQQGSIYARRGGSGASVYARSRTGR